MQTHNNGSPIGQQHKFKTISFWTRSSWQAAVACMWIFSTWKERSASLALQRPAIQKALVRSRIFIGARLCPNWHCTTRKVSLWKDTRVTLEDVGWYSFTCAAAFLSKIWGWSWQVYLGRDTGAQAGGYIWGGTLRNTGDPAGGYLFWASLK